MMADVESKYSYQRQLQSNQRKIFVTMFFSFATVKTSLHHYSADLKKA